jgi:hypothetical protein
MAIYAVQDVLQAFAFFLMGTVFAFFTYAASKNLYRAAIQRVIHAPMAPPGRELAPSLHDRLAQKRLTIDLGVHINSLDDSIQRTCRSKELRFEAPHHEGWNTFLGLMTLMFTTMSGGASVYTVHPQIKILREKPFDEKSEYDPRKSSSQPSSRSSTSAYQVSFSQWIFHRMTSRSGSESHTGSARDNAL